jgi:hypothetical protein
MLIEEFQDMPAIGKKFRSNLLDYLSWSFPAGQGGEKETMNQEDGYSISRALLLIGGIVAIAFGATALGANIFTARTYADLLTFSGPLFAMVVGVVALVTSSKVNDEALNVVLAVLGFIAGGAGGVLVAIAGVWAIISRHTLKAQA